MTGVQTCALPICEHYGEKFAYLRGRMMELLAQESELQEIVKLIGADILPEDQKCIINTARVTRLGFLQQNAYHPVDTYVPIEKQIGMMALIIQLHDGALRVAGAGIPLSQLTKSGIFERLIRIKYDVPNDQLSLLEDYAREIDELVEQVLANS